MKLEILQLLSILVVGAQSSTQCNSPLYCDGKFLKAIQMNQVLNDGKEIVDRATKKPLADVVKDFKALKDKSKRSLQIFVTANFHEAGYEVEEVKLENFDRNPAFLENIRDPIFRGFANQIHNLWSTLVRRANTKKLCKGCSTSLLTTNHNFIVPGGRFREFYYWDSYFALEGVNKGGLFQISKDMILNLLDFVKNYGFVPNGARIYFLNRSQPPLLTQMIKRYVKASKDNAFIKEHIRVLDKEYDYWINRHNVKVDCPDSKHDCFLTRYVVNNTHPRPESYREDVETAKPLKRKQREQLYADLAAGAESGWDFSTRWVPGSKGNKELLASQETTLRGIRTSEIVPVDLNAIMYANEKALYKFHRMLSKSSRTRYHTKKMEMYKQAYKKRSKLMAHILWDKETCSFYDYNIETEQLNKEFFPSNVWPFWAKAVHSSIATRKNIVGAFKHVQNARKAYPGGVPTSKTKGSLLQWDYPNTWAPLEYMIVESGLNAVKLLKDQESKAQVKTITHQVAQTYVNTTFCAWYNSGGAIKGSLRKKKNLPKNQTGFMYEKYNVKVIGGAGGGGEYEIQTGFGWSNGVLIHLLAKFGKEFNAPKSSRMYCNPK
ncbi:Trehalase [Entomophthora muscae]|uniref:Trehalase n=2 Tax=Entomophthora muscae TaxID=34485 RepID=A0ACC2SML8_9FUNG|nr:putative Trehalase [Entomophthora muscae]KAJ9063507.1 Trehalase [Entomophthora muscae]